MGWSSSFVIAFISNRILVVKDDHYPFFPNDFFNFVGSYVSFQPNFLLKLVYNVVISSVKEVKPSYNFQRRI